MSCPNAIAMAKVDHRCVENLYQCYQREGPLAQHKISANKDTDSSSIIEHSTDVHVPVRPAYNQWTQFEEFPHCTKGVMEVRQLGDTPLQAWDAVITERLLD